MRDHVDSHRKVQRFGNGKSAATADLANEFVDVRCRGSSLRAVVAELQMLRFDVAELELAEHEKRGVPLLQQHGSAPEKRHILLNKTGRPHLDNFLFPTFQSDNEVWNIGVPTFKPDVQPNRLVPQFNHAWSQEQGKDGLPLQFRLMMDRVVEQPVGTHSAHCSNRGPMDDLPRRFHTPKSGKRNSTLDLRGT